MIPTSPSKPILKMPDNAAITLLESSEHSTHVCPVLPVVTQDVSASCS